jgi:2-hydroxychromene-2-carboxylate isomerase
MAKTLEFFFDYASPYSYLACQQVEAVVKRTGAELRWRPLLLCEAPGLPHPHFDQRAQ